MKIRKLVKDVLFEIKWLFDYKLNYNYALNFLYRRYDLIRTGLLKSQWHDKDHVMLYGMMNLLVDYVEKEECFEIINFDDDDESRHIKKEIEAIYKWWKHYPKRLMKIDKIYDKIKFKESPFTIDEDGRKVYKVDRDHNGPIYDLIHKEEEKLYQEEQDMLKRLIDIRGSLWT